MDKVGQNEPCPCGSGKKYKHCCLGKEPPQRILSAMDELRAAIEGKTFHSLDELNIFARAFMESKNRIPQLDFLGLSSDQMHRLLEFPFANTDEIVGINGNLPPSAFLVIPIVKNSMIFLAKLDEREPIKATAKGNLPLSFVRELFVCMELPERRYHPFPIRTEGEVTLLHALRGILTLCGWIKKRSGRFSLTDSGRKILQGGFDGIGFRHLLEVFTLKFNWGFMDRYPRFLIVQKSFLFGLYLLHRWANREIEDQALAEHFLRAFPQALEEAHHYETPYQTGASLLSGCFTLRFLERFCEYFGFLTIRREAIPGRFVERKFVQTTDFFLQYWQWRVHDDRH